TVRLHLRRTQTSLLISFFADSLSLKAMKHFKSISEMAVANNLPLPEHPMLGLLRLDGDIKINNTEYTSDFYLIGLKKVKSGYVLYGRTRFDHETGSMIFLKPRQVVEMRNLEFEED